MSGIQKFVLTVPMEVTDAMLTSHSVAESEVDWNSGTTYALGDEVKYGSDHDKFSSKQNSNLNQTPVKYPDETAYWYDEGKTNRWNMFDYGTNIQTSGTSPMTVVIEPGKPISALYFDGLEADEVTVSISDGTSEVYSHTEDTRTRNVYDWYTFFFEEYEYKKSFILLDIPAAVALPEITVTFTDSTGTTKCAAMAFGRHYIWGTTRIVSTASRQSFSQFDRDDFGNLRLIPRVSAKKITAVVTADRRDVPMINRHLAELDAKIAIWTAESDDESDFFEPFSLRGVYRTPSIQVMETYEKGHAQINLDLEGV